MRLYILMLFLFLNIFAGPSDSMLNGIEFNQLSNAYFASNIPHERTMLLMNAFQAYLADAEEALRTGQTAVDPRKMLPEDHIYSKKLDLYNLLKSILNGDDYRGVRDALVGISQLDDPDFLETLFSTYTDADRFPGHQTDLRAQTVKNVGLLYAKYKSRIARDFLLKIIDKQPSNVEIIAAVTAFGQSDDFEIRSALQNYHDALCRVIAKNPDGSKGFEQLRDCVKNALQPLPFYDE